MTTFRRTGTTSAAVLSGLVAMFGLMHVAAPEWAQQAGLDVWNFAEAQERMRATTEESARLRDEVEQLRESIEAAEHLTEDGTFLKVREISLGLDAKYLSVSDQLAIERHCAPRFTPGHRLAQADPVAVIRFDAGIPRKIFAAEQVAGEDDLLSLLWRRRTQRIDFGPLGMRDVIWPADAQGSPMAGATSCSIPRTPPNSATSICTAASGF
jgi:uncharacterized small protein (DUF1192 family)